MNTVAIDTMIETKGYKLGNVDVVYRADRKGEPRRRRYPNGTYGHGYFPQISVILMKDEETVCFSDKYDNLGTFADDLAAIGEIIKTHFSNVKIKKYDYDEDYEEEEE